MTSLRGSRAGWREQAMREGVRGHGGTSLLCSRAKGRARHNTSGNYLARRAAAISFRIAALP